VADRIEAAAASKEQRDELTRDLVLQNSP